jgi:catechol 2,3-dioxygenase-like lactoylglutathione lyase family enzyme
MSSRPLTRIRRAGLAVALALLAAQLEPAPGFAGAAADSAAAPAPVALRAVGPIGISVADLDRSLDFYQRILGFEPIAAVDLAGEPLEELEGVAGLRMRVAILRLGDERIVLSESATPRGRPIAADARANDHDFQHVAIVVRDMARAYAWLRDNGVRHASTSPQRLPDWNASAAGIEAFYFRDPDGHFLELLAFPPDKGDSRWHRPGDDVFLGIDHTAIVVSDTETSLRLYRDLLGMRVAGESENSGPEQEHLNDVPGAHLRITTLRAGSGPGVELLEYLAPRDGRPAARDARANDLVHWQTRLVVDDVARVAAALRAVHATFVSPGPVTFTVDGAPLGFTTALLVRDPDGHALELTDDASPATGKENAP